MKNSTSIVMGLILAAVVGGMGVLVYIDGHRTAPAQSQNVGGDSFAQTGPYLLTPGAGTSQDPGQLSATTTKVYLTVGANASSTISGSLEDGNSIDLNMRAIASSSAATLRYTLDVSPNGIDYYPYMDPSLSATTTPPYPLIVGDAKYTWSLSTTTDSICGTNEVCKHSVISQLTSKYFRIRFDVTGAAAAVWAEARVREIVPN